MKNNENNILYLNDYGMVGNQEEQYEENVQLNLASYDDIDYLLSSSDSYTDKIATLKAEREKAQAIKEYCDVALHAFENGEFYLKNMEETDKNIIEDLRYEVPMSLGSTFGSIIGLYGFFTHLDNLTTSDNIFYVLLFSTITAVMIAATAVLGPKAIKHAIEHKNYDREIKRYKKILKEKTIK